jgi:hypothetical protein
VAEVQPINRKKTTIITPSTSLCPSSQPFLCPFISHYIHDIIFDMYLFSSQLCDNTIHNAVVDICVSLGITPSKNKRGCNRYQPVDHAASTIHIGTLVSVPGRFRF